MGNILSCPLHTNSEFDSYSELASHLMNEHQQLALDYLVAFLVGISEGNHG